MFRAIDSYLLRKPKFFVLLVAVSLIVVLGFIDHSIGSQISFSVFYTAPVLLATWYCNRSAGIFLSFLAAAVWLAADLTSGHEYAHILIPFWNAMVRMGFFLLITILIALVKKKLALEEALADTDFLTGLKNSRSFNEHLEVEAVRSRRYQRPFTLAYLDLDNFKHINDTYGHSTGDEVLQTVSKTMREHVRQSDIISRLGGDEFAGLFPETDFQAAEKIIHNLMLILTEAMTSRQWPITFSIGAVTFVQPLDSVREMIKKVDDLMYRVKKSGKNNVVHIS